MRTFRQSMYAVLAIAVAMVFGAGVASAAYDQGDQDQGQQYQNQQQDQYPGADQGDQSQQYQGRNLQLERQIARQLRNQGFGEQGEIMILATGDRVILLGNVPDRDSKNGAEQAAKQVSGVQRVDNRLHAVSQPRQMSDSQLQRDTYRRLPDRLAQNVKVQAQNGTVTLQGNLDNWKDAADAIDAAFASGAQQVNSQIMVGAATAGAGRYGATSGAAGGYAPSYGYAPGTRGQQMGGRGQASGSDLRLAQQVAQQLRQELPPEQNIEVVRPMSIYVTVKNGTATLHGYVQDNNQKQQAEQIARSVRGVRRVTNDLAILSGAGSAGQGQYGQGGAGTMGTQGMAGTRGSMSDRRLAQQIQQQLQNQFPDASINVTASQGTVMLQGTVSDLSQKQQAEQIAQSIPGVQNVQNNLTVAGQGGGYFPPQGYVPGQGSQMQQGTGGMGGQYGGQPGAMGARQAAMSAADMALAQQIAQKLHQQLSGIQNIQVERSDTIYVMATRGTVMLHGFVANQNLKQQATTIARAIPGVRNVENTLNISSAAGVSPSYGYIPGQRSQTQQGAGGMSSQDTTGQYSEIAWGNQGQSSQSSKSAKTKAFGSTRADRSKAMQIEQKLRSQLPNSDITVIVSNGYATLWGTAANTQEKQQAQQIAQSVSGLRSVTNNLTVGGQQAAAGMSGQQAAGGMGDQYGSQSSAAGLYTQIAYSDEDESDQSDQDTQTAGTQAKAFGASAADLAKAQAIQQNLQSQLPDADVTVTVSGNNATLWGTAPDAQEKQQAQQIAQSVGGVSSVTNNLTVGSQQAASDMGDMGGQQTPSLRFVADANQTTAMADMNLAQQVAQMLQQQLRGVANVRIMRPNTIYVMVSKGNVTLDGLLPDKNVKDEAERIAKAVPGVNNVKNSLTVGPTGTLGQAGGQQYGGRQSTRY